MFRRQIEPGADVGRRDPDLSIEGKHSLLDFGCRYRCEHVDELRQTLRIALWWGLNVVQGILRHVDGLQPSFAVHDDDGTLPDHVITNRNDRGFHLRLPGTCADCSVLWRKSGAYRSNVGKLF
ncbi:hypothetical protein AGRO_1411 [Agrobacterium sp. ATCC 31749]|nr:hypothetical protein AGRO_1411 [Agrobacterium sp. ATCC 31749]